MPRPRKPKAMKWNVFVGRRRMDVASWLHATGIMSYDALVEWCADANVEPPTNAELRAMFGARSRVRAAPVPSADSKPKPQVTSLAPKKPAKKPAKKPVKASVGD